MVDLAKVLGMKLAPLPMAQGWTYFDGVNPLERGVNDVEADENSGQPRRHEGVVRSDLHR